jgi:hypothetical protein
MQSAEKSKAVDKSLYFVADYIANPETWKTTDKYLYEGDEYKFEKPDSIDNVVSGTILGLKADQNTSLSDGDFTIYLLSPPGPHCSVPVIPGDFVWAIKDGLGNLRYTGRAGTDSRYECVNNSTPLRKTIENKETKQSTKDKSETGKTSPPAPDESNKSFPLFTSSKEIETFLIDFFGTPGARDFIGEIVPRLPTRGPDYSFQGSNNTAIILTTDVENGTRKGSGAIDIVVGRGQTPETAPAETVKNDRGDDEIVKTPSVEQNENEGEPDFVNDLSRVYISMDTTADAKFGITAVPNLSDAGAITTTSEQGPCVASKSTNQIIIARAEGSIRIIHESGSNIIMDSDGNIQIKCGPDGQIRIGATDASTQHVIRGDQMMDAIDVFCTALELALAQGGNLGVPLTGFVDMQTAFTDFKDQSRLALSAIVQTE